MAHDDQLVIFARPYGFCSLILHVLGHTWLRRGRGPSPIAYFNRQSLYWSDAGYHGARNVWEYYFEPLSPVRITDLIDADFDRIERATIWELSRSRPELPVPAGLVDRVGTIPVRAGTIITDVFPLDAIDWIWEIPSRRQSSLHETLASLRLRPFVSQKIETFAGDHMRGHPTIGVHIRGAERRVERTHLVPGGVLSLTCYTQEIDAYLARHPTCRIFCATDTQWMLDALTARYGTRLISYPAARLGETEEQIGLHNSARNDKAVLGEEVLIESVLLSRCDFLVHGLSNVSLLSMLLNPRMPRVNVYAKYGYRWPRLRLATVSRLIRWKQRLFG